MKRLFGFVHYETRANESGWCTKYFWPEIVECDIEAELTERPEGVSPGAKESKEMVRYTKDLTSFGWRTKTIERYQYKPNSLRPEEWLRTKAREYHVFNLDAVEKLCNTGSIMNTLPPEHQMAYQFYS